jgi:uncharacterized membrane protein
LYAFWKLLHVFGFVAWFIGLVGSTSTAAAARRAPSAEARLTAWNAGRRLWLNEKIGMVLTPISGLMLGVVLAGGFGEMFTSPALRFVHIKLTLVILALIGNLLLLRQRTRVAAALEAGGPELEAAFKRMAMMQGITTMMLPIAVFVVVLMKHA